MTRHICLFLLLSAATLGFAADSANLVGNPSLEGDVGAAGLPEGWFAFQKPENAYQFRVVGGGRTGAKSLRIEGAGEYGGLLVNRIPYEPGKQYAARGWVRLEGNEETVATVKLDYFGENQEYLASSYFDGHVRSGVKDWQLLSVISRPADAKNARFVGATIAIGGKGSAWFDDLAMVARDGAPAPANLLHNGSMEDVVATQPFGYHLYTSEGGKVRVGWSDRESKDGWYSLHLKGTSEWAVAMEGKVPFEKGKTYSLTGFARAASGTAQIKIDYYKGDQYLGLTVSNDVTQDEWKKLVVTSERDRYPEATHVAAAAVGLGDIDARFDGLAFTAK